MRIGIGLGVPLPAGTVGTGSSPTDEILLEDGTALLCEDGTDLALES